MPSLKFQPQICNQALNCSLCAVAIAPGEMFWTAFLGDSNEPVMRVCTCHIPMNTTAIESIDGESSSSLATVRANGWKIQDELIPKLIAHPDHILDLSAEDFEALVLDRFLKMGAEAFRIGPANKKDGGIDIVFWTKSLFPFVGAVQIRHRQTMNGKVGPSEIRELIGAMNGKRFNIGILVTNGRFTDDAKAQAIHCPTPIQLRDSESILRWIKDDFSVESLDLKMRLVEFCPDVIIDMPHFG